MSVQLDRTAALPVSPGRVPRWVSPAKLYYNYVSSYLYSRLSYDSIPCVPFEFKEVCSIDYINVVLSI